MFYVYLTFISALRKEAGKVKSQMFAALVAGWCISCSMPVAIVNKIEGRTEFNANSEIFYLDFSVDITGMFFG